MLILRRSGRSRTGWVPYLIYLLPYKAYNILDRVTVPYLEVHLLAAPINDAL